MSGDSSLPALDLESSSAGSRSPQARATGTTSSLPQLKPPRSPTTRISNPSTTTTTTKTRGGTSAKSSEAASVIGRVKSSLSSSRYTTGRYFQKDLSIVCYRCSKVGHRAEECQEETENRVERPCFLCARTTHLAKDCTYQICKECGRLGHRPDACQADVALKATPENVGLYAESSMERFSFADVKCMTCNKYGHISCTEAQPGYKKIYLCPTDMKDVQFYCANCGGAGHIYSACTEPTVSALLGRDFFNDFVKCFSCNTYGHVGRRCPNQGQPKQNYRKFAAPPSFNHYPPRNPGPRHPHSRPPRPRMPVTRQIMPPRGAPLYRHNHNHHGPPRPRPVLRFPSRHSRFDRHYPRPQRTFGQDQQCSNCAGFGHSAAHCPSAPRFPKRRRYR